MSGSMIARLTRWWVPRPAYAGTLVALFATIASCGLVILEKTGVEEFQVIATVCGLALFVWLYVHAPSVNRVAVIAFLFIWAAYVIAGFTARTEYLIGSDIHREYRAVIFLGDSPHWNPLALGEISFSSASLVIGTRVLADFAGVSPFFILKYVYPVILAATALPLYRTFEETLDRRGALASVFLAISMLTFWESTSQIAKASISFLIMVTLVYALVVHAKRGWFLAVVSTVLASALVFTHYTSSLIVFAMLAIAWIFETVAQATITRATGTKIRRSFTLALPVAIGGVMYAAYYRGIPYVSEIVFESVADPIDHVIDLLTGESGARRGTRGANLSDTLGADTSIGYWSLRISLMIVALAIAAGWVSWLRRAHAHPGLARRTLRGHAIATAALAIAAVAALVPSALDVNRVFAFALLLAAALATRGVYAIAGWGGRKRAGRFGTIVVVAIVAASQLGLVFLAADGVAFSTNLGDDGPVYARYAYTRETENVRDWVKDAGNGSFIAVSPHLFDYLQEDHAVPESTIFSMKDLDVLAGRPDEIKQYRGVLCIGERDDEHTLVTRPLVYTTGTLAAFAMC